MIIEGISGKVRLEIFHTGDCVDVTVYNQFGGTSAWRLHYDSVQEFMAILKAGFGQITLKRGNWIMKNNSWHSTIEITSVNEIVEISTCSFLSPATVIRYKVPSTFPHSPKYKAWFDVSQISEMVSVLEMVRT